MLSLLVFFLKILLQNSVSFSVYQIIGITLNTSDDKRNMNAESNKKDEIIEDSSYKAVSTLSNQVNPICSVVSPPPNNQKITKKQIQSFIEEIINYYRRASSTLVLGEMDYSLARSIVNIIDTRDEINTLTNSNQKKKRKRKKRKKKNIKVFYATSYHNRVNIGSLKVLEKDRIKQNINSHKQITIFNKNDIPHYEDQKVLINDLLLNEFENCMESNILEILGTRKLDCRIVAGVDATDLKCYPLFDVFKNESGFDLIVFGFPRTKWSFPSANGQFMKSVLQCLKQYLKKGQLHLLMHVSEQKNKDSIKTSVKQFDNWQIMSDKVIKDEWIVLKRKVMSFDTIKTVFPSYIPRDERGREWQPDRIEYIIMVPNRKKLLS